MGLIDAAWSKEIDLALCNASATDHTWRTIGLSRELLASRAASLQTPGWPAKKMGDSYTAPRESDTVHKQAMEHSLWEAMHVRLA